MSMPPEEFYGTVEPRKGKRGLARSRAISRMTSALVFLRTGFIGAFIAIAALHLLGPRFGYAGNGYDFGGLAIGFALGAIIEIARRKLGNGTQQGAADRI